jgi:hypothetical protein
MLIWVRSIPVTSKTDWQVTATTIYCDAVDDEVTVLVYKDWSTRCTGYIKYRESAKAAANQLRKKAKRLGRPLECEGLECRRVTQYKEKLAREETEKGH